LFPGVNTTATGFVFLDVPRQGDSALFWDPKNLQTLCHPHHSSSKQQVEKRGYLKDIGVDGWPVDTANHPVYRHK